MVGNIYSTREPRALGLGIFDETVRNESHLCKSMPLRQRLTSPNVLLGWACRKCVGEVRWSSSSARPLRPLRKSSQMYLSVKCGYYAPQPNVKKLL